MNMFGFTFSGAQLQALPSGALYWPAQGLLVVSDLHFGKAARQARFGGAVLPPYEVSETLARLEADLTQTDARTVICLGDSFDAPGLEGHLPERDHLRLTTLQAGRHWVWIEGNHDPAPVALGGEHLAEVQIGSLLFRHISASEAQGEVSGHYHPKARLVLRGRSLSRPCFLYDQSRLIMPAYGTYTGGLFTQSAPLSTMMDASARAILTGPRPVDIPMPR